jgi:hypothetical protein
MVSLIGLATIFGFTSGLMDEVNAVDFTKISFIIFGTFLFYSGYIGKLTYDATGNNHTNKSIDRITNQTESGWFASDCFTAAGMIGTIIGFIFMMSSSFDNVSAGNVQQVIVFALGKMGLALYTTASGLICSLLLKIQLFNLSQYLEKFRPTKKDDNLVCMVCDE